MARRKKRKRKYSKGASGEVGREIHRAKRGKAKSGGGRHGKVKSRKQAIAIGLSKARKKGKKVPPKKGKKKRGGRRTKRGGGRKKRS